jgi:hypothetical protein
VVTPFLSIFFYIDVGVLFFLFFASSFSFGVGVQGVSSIDRPNRQKKAGEDGGGIGQAKESWKGKADFF